MVLSPAMRRPLNGNGTPFVFTSALVPVEVFNTEDFGLDQTYAVTLFALQLSVPGLEPPNTVFSVILSQNGEALPATVLETQLRLVTAVAARNGTFQTHRPQILLDRFVMRGKQRLDVQASSYGGVPVQVFGWFERVGEQEVPGNFRGLQPNNALVSPFNVPFLNFETATGGAVKKQTLHLLDNAEEHLDLLTIYVSAYTLGAVANTDGACAVLLPGGVSINVPVLVGSISAEFQGPFTVLEGIPMRAPSSADNKIEIQVTPDVAENITVNAFGRFTRG